MNKHFQGYTTHLVKRLMILLLVIQAINLANINAQSPQSMRSDILVRHILNTGTASTSVRIAKDPRDNSLYYAKYNGTIYRLNLSSNSSAPVHTSSEHGIAFLQGMAIGLDGAIYLVGNESRPNVQTRGKIVKGTINSSGQRSWSILAITEDYSRSNTAFDHGFNGIIVSNDNNYIYVNSGSRTDHGEIQSAEGRYPNLREVGLTACIFRLPTNGQNILLQNNRETLRNNGYIFAEGTRNSFDMAFAPNGDLIATDNGPDRDMSDELNWLRQGQHYGFPWRLGGTDNPQQYPDYNPANDLLLNPQFIAVKNGYFYNDPTFPQRPSSLTEPIANLGPDADSFRDPVDGIVKDASSLGLTIGTFTSHRSPLGLIFDRSMAMSDEFQGDGFMLSWTKGDPTGDSVAGPFKDPGQDLLHLNLTKLGDNYQVRTTRIVGGFSNPIDAEILGNKIYVLEHGGQQAIWEITIPANTGNTSTITLSLGEKWNLISLPRQPKDTTITSVLASIAGKYSAVHAFNGASNSYRSYIPGSSEPNTLLTMEANRGYWILMNQAATLTINDTVAPQNNIELNQNWNLVGYSNTQEMPISEALSSINGKYSIVYAWDNSSQNYIGYAPPDITTLTSMQPGKGYWILANAPTTWTLPIKDSQPPTAPVNLQVSSKTDTTISFTWSASTDNVAVVSYQIFRNSNPVGTTSETSFTDTGLTPSTSYAYTVRAMDAVGNISNASSTVNVTTNAATPGVGSIIEKDPSFRNIVPSGAKIEKVAGGFKFTEGPIWVKEGAGYLLFSDIGNDAIMKWTPSGTVSTFRKPSDRSNGLTLDKQGRLIICDQANRRMSRLEPNGTLTVLASTYQNRRFNSPNDAVYGSEGSLYFTDPPYGLSNPSLQELNFQGVFRLAPNGTVQLLVRNLSRPNGIALSPDEKTLYVANSDSNNKVWMAYTLGTTGGVSNGRVFYNASQANEEGLPDGLKVDIQGNLYCTGPGGVWVFSPQGTHLGTIKPPEVATNCHWGDQDGKTLYITATTGLYRIRLNIQGIRP